MTHHRTCCCQQWTIVHKLDAAGVLLWSVWPSFLPYPSNAACRVLLLVDSRLIAYIQDDANNAWLCEIDTSTGETGAWSTCAAYVDVFTDGSHIYGARAGTGASASRIEALDQISLTTFAVESSALWAPQSRVNALVFDTFHTWDSEAGLFVIPEFQGGSSGGGPTTLTSRITRLDPTSFPPAVDSSAFTLTSGPTIAIATSAIPLGSGIYQTGRARWTHATIEGSPTTIQVDAWTATGVDPLDATLVDTDYVYAIRRIAQNNIHRTPRAGTGGAGASWIVSDVVFNMQPWASTIVGTRLALAGTSASAAPTSGHGSITVLDTTDASLIWSVVWPAQRQVTGPARGTHTVVMTGTNLVYAGTPPTDTRGLAP